MSFCIILITEVNRLTFFKDLILILLSGLAIFSTYRQHRATKRETWIREFRSIVAKIVSTISTSLEKNDGEYHKKVFELFSLLVLYIDTGKKSHIKIIDDISDLKSAITDFEKRIKTSEEVSKCITKLIATARNIIKEENEKWL